MSKSKFDHEETNLINLILNQILDKNKNSYRDSFEYSQGKASPEENYVGETLYQNITYDTEPFLIMFRKHLIDVNPDENYKKNFMVKANKFFDQDIFRTSFEAHPYRWRRNFQDQIYAFDKYNLPANHIETINKESSVKGISVTIYSGQIPINIIDPGGEERLDLEEDCTFHIQTNNINKAKQNCKKYFIVNIVKALDHTRKKTKKMIKKIEAKHKKKKIKRK